MSYYKKRTLTFTRSNVIEGYCIVGPKEAVGALQGNFDMTVVDDRMGQSSFEKAERKMFLSAVRGVLNKANMQECDIDTLIGGDLLNQLVSTSFTAREMHMGFLGLYNACATFVESLIVGSSMLNNGIDNVLCVSGSHFATAERQYRFPLELGVLRSPVSQWTATGAGATILASNAKGACARITRATIGRVVDYNVADVNNMGAAMAPAAVDTLLTFLHDTNSGVDSYDCIVTGDLGKLGHEIFVDLCRRQNVDLVGKSIDCGVSLYYDSQQTYQGGSGAGCSAIVFNSGIMSQLRSGKLGRILLIGTGALMSTTTSFQGDSIPCIAHLVEVEGGSNAN